MIEEIDFIQPKKIVGQLISIDVLDKIRAEIDARREKLKIMADDDWYAGKIRGYDCAIEIIDKYKAESEVQERLKNGLIQMQKML